MLRLVLQHTNAVTPVSWRNRFHANRLGRSCKIYGRYDVSPIKPSWNFREFDSASWCSTTWARHNDLAKNTRAEVQQALTGTDTSNLRASFRRSLSFSVPPLTLYRNYRPGAYSDLIFGVPLVDVETNEDNVPKVLRMCIEEVEKRGLNAKGIYSVSWSRLRWYSCLVVTGGLSTRCRSTSEWNPCQRPNY